VRRARIARGGPAGDTMAKYIPAAHTTTDVRVLFNNDNNLCIYIYRYVWLVGIQTYKNARLYTIIIYNNVYGDKFLSVGKKNVKSTIAIDCIYLPTDESRIHTRRCYCIYFIIICIITDIRRYLWPLLDLLQYIMMSTRFSMRTGPCTF